MTRLMIVVGSVRPVRKGLAIAEWVRDAAIEDGRFDVDFVDLQELALPFMDEPQHPARHQYSKAHTIAWSERVEAADAFIFVTPEYNWSYSPALKNAMDYLSGEWNRKPLAFISYGGISAGTRGFVAMLPTVTMLGMVVAKVHLHISLLSAPFDADGVFVPDAFQGTGVAAQLDDLAALATALKPLR